MCEDKIIPFETFWAARKEEKRKEILGLIKNDPVAFGNFCYKFFFSDLPRIIKDDPELYQKYLESIDPDEG